MIKYYCDKCGRYSSKPLPYISKLYHNGKIVVETMLCDDCYSEIYVRANSQTMQVENNYK